MAQRSTVGSALSAWSFFMRLLPFPIGMGNLGPRFAQPKAALPKQALTLTHRQAHLKVLGNPSTQRFPIPQGSGQTEVARRPTQSLVHFQQLRLAQTSGTPGALPFTQPAPRPRSVEP